MDFERLNELALRFLPYIGAVLAAYVIYIVGQQLAKTFFKQKTSMRVKNLMGVTEEKKVKPSDFGSPEFKIRLAFSKYNIDVYQKEMLALNIARIVVSLILIGLIHMIFGLPLITSMAGGLAGS